MRTAVLSLLCSLVLVSPTVAFADDGQVQIPLKRYEELMAAARQQGGAVATWTAGSVSVELPTTPGGAAQVTVSTRLTASGEGSVRVPVIAAEVVLRDARIDGTPALFASEGGVLMATVPAGRPVDVTLRYTVAPAGGEGDGRAAVIPLPPLASSELTVTGGVRAEDIEVWPAVDVQRSGTTLSAAMPASHGLVVRWGAWGAAQAVRRADLVIAPERDGEGADVEATYDVVVSGAQALVRVAPPGAALVDVREGAELLGARFTDEGHFAVVSGRGRHVVKAHFRVRVDRSQGQPQLTLGVERVPITRVEVTVDGQRDVSFDPPSPPRLTVTGEGDGAKTRAEAHLPPTDRVVVRWTESRAAPEDLVRVNTETYQLVTLNEAVMRSRVVIRYQVIRGAVRELPVELPEDAVLFKVNGVGVDDWRTFAKSDEGPRQARIYLNTDIVGEYSLELELETVVATAEGTPVSLLLVRPLGAYREMGVVALFDGDKVAFGPTEPAGYTKVGEDALPVEVRQGLTDKVTQAFKHVGAPGAVASVVSAAKEREVRFDARVDTLYFVKDGALIGNASVIVEVKSGRRDDIVVSVPEAVTVLGVNAPSLNKAEPAKDFDAGPGRKGHRISFTRALEGAIQIDLELELLLPKELGRIGLPDVRVEGAEVEEGAFGITAETGIEVQAGEVTDARQVDSSELPRSVRLRSEREIVLGYTYTRAPWSVGFDVRRHRTVETLSAVVKRAWLATTILEDGHVVSHATYDVTNGDRQYLRLTLPAGHKVWSVTSDGVAVKAVSDEQGALAIPVRKGADVRIDVIYEVRRDPLGFVGGIELVAPKADLLVTDLKWLVRAPKRMSLWRVSTDLERGEPWEFHQSYEATPGLEVPFSLPDSQEFQELLFTWAVHDPTEEALSVGVSFVATPGPGLGVVMGLLALLLLVAVVRRRARGEALDGREKAFLVLGLLLLVVRAIGWGISPAEGGVAIGVLAAVALVSAWRARGEGGGHEA
jgi:hypothetical protein